MGQGVGPGGPAPAAAAGGALGIPDAPAASPDAKDGKDQLASKKLLEHVGETLASATPKPTRKSVASADSPIAQEGGANHSAGAAGHAPAAASGIAEGLARLWPPLPWSGGQDPSDAHPSSSQTLPPVSVTAVPKPLKENEQLSREPWTHDPAGMKECTDRFRAPQPDGATDLNGIVLPPVCFLATDEPHHVFVIGDWGGISPSEGMIPVPADHRSPKFHHRRPFVLGADNSAQLNVAEQMTLRAERSRPDYVLNVGDNMYWGGVHDRCGKPVAWCDDKGGQWERIFERIYRGAGLEAKQWLGVLGNHDYGGHTFANGWDQTIAYTWATGGASSGRWFTPALYWTQQVRYRGFAVDYFFVDSNVFDAFDPSASHNHNICSRQNNPKNASCGSLGPSSVDDCFFWFQRLWDAQAVWLDKALEMSFATWQIVVTHFPPEWGANHWKILSYKHGIDLILSGHRHQQEVHHLPYENFLSPTAYIVSGGGGGITSESVPSADGNDDQYGFMDLALTKDEILIEAISHGGAVRKRSCVARRLPQRWEGESVAKSMCQGLDKGPLPAPKREGKGKFYVPDTRFFFDAARQRHPDLS